MPPKQPPTPSPRDQRPSKPRASSPIKTTYLLAYNAVSAALWAGVLYKTVTIGASEIQTARKAGSFFGRSEAQSVAAGLASGKVFAELDGYTRMVQSLAGLEVLHSLLGMLSFFWCPLARYRSIRRSSATTDGFSCPPNPPT
jgi:very-long-chain (3R)-3-hydroxyacyl-CoA dehydratase